MQTRRELTDLAFCYSTGCGNRATGEMLDPVDRTGETWLPVCRRHGGYPTPPLVCAGRAVDGERLAAIGEACGRKFKGVGTWGVEVEEQREQARAAGWSVGGPPMCPSCRRPDPAIALGLTAPAGVVQLPL